MERFEILQKRELAQDVFFLKVYAPVIARAAQPGQFLIVINDAQAERIPLTISDYSVENGTVDIVVQAIGFSTRKIVQHEVGECFADVVGPLGNPSEFIEIPLKDLQNRKLLFVAGGIGAAPIYAQVKYFQQKGIQTTTIIGARSSEFIILEEAFRQTGTNLFLCTDNGSRGFNGNVTELLSYLVEHEKMHFDHVIAIGPLIMMKFVEQTTRKYNLPCVASLNSLMIDGTGMCGACRVTVDGKTRFTCVDGPEFDAHKVNFDEALNRQKNKNVRKDSHNCNLDIAVDEKQKVRNTRVPVREQPASIRRKNFEEVCYGYNEEEAMREAVRCLQCKKPRCVGSCPVQIDIPGFISEVAKGNFQRAYEILSLSTSLAAVCGRVCPQETQCEGECILGIKGEAVAIGKLERFVADWALSNVQVITKELKQNATKVAVVGSGPAGLTCAGDLAKMGYRVTVFEALQKAGGVLEYGIPEFRLPKKAVVAKEVERLTALGVDIQTDYIVGRVGNVDLLLQSGFDAVFIGAGAGLPRFMNLPGENFNGVYSANEFLTRVNLMQAYRDDFDTPVELTPKVVVIGGGNVAMDAARTAIRLGSKVTLVYRRSESELPARREEIHHAKEEGVDFQLLTNPVEFLGDVNSDLQSVRCVRMQLGEPDESGRRRPETIEGSDFIIEAGTAIVAIGTSPNPLLKKTAPEVSLNKWNCIDADNEWGKTTQPGVFAGGDVVTGAATVIEAMGAGKRAAKAIDNYIKNIKNQSYAL